MKKITCLIILMITAICLKAQTDGGVIASNASYKCVLLEKDGKQYRYSIECSSILNGKGEIWIKPSDIRKFIDALYSLKSKYVELANAAKAYKVNNLKEKIKVKFPKTEFALGHRYYGNGKLSAEFNKYENGIVYQYVTIFDHVNANNIGISDKRIQETLFHMGFHKPE